MPKNPNYSLALYEKAMPSGLGFGRMLECAAQTGFDRLEISIDESDARLARLDWTCEQKQELVGQIRQSGVPIRTMCLSGHRKYPFGAHNAAVRARSLEIMKKAVDFAAEVGVSVIQLAGYDVYYEPGDTQTRAWFAESLQKAVGLAAAAGLMPEFAREHPHTLRMSKLQTGVIGRVSGAEGHVAVNAGLRFFEMNSENVTCALRQIVCNAVTSSSTPFTTDKRNPPVKPGVLHMRA